VCVVETVATVLFCPVMAAAAEVDAPPRYCEDTYMMVATMKPTDSRVLFLLVFRDFFITYILDTL